MLKLGLIQMRCEKGAIDDNLDRIAATLDTAEALGVELVGFPEMSITGYVDPTRYPEAVIALDGPEVARFLALTHGRSSTVAAGLVERHPEGRKPYITHIVARDGDLVGVYRKVTIQDEEADWFTPGAGVPVFRHAGLTFGISICADIGNEEVFAACRRQGTSVVLELAAPGLYGEQATRNWASGYAWWEGVCMEKLSGYAETYGLWIGVATQAGRTVDEDFPGGGYVFAPDGTRRCATADGSPGALYVGIDLDDGQVIRLR